MASPLCHVMAALATLAAVTSGTAATGQIRAATVYRRGLILFNADGQAVSATTNQVIPFFPVPSNFPMTAATCLSSPNSWYPSCIFYSDNLIYYGNTPVPYANRDDLYYPNLFPKFVWYGLDAVVNTYGDDYYFKDCNYITRDANGNLNETVRDMAELGIPCNVDAGWYDGTNAVVLKDNQVWKIGHDRNDPQDFNEYVSQTFG